MTEVSIGWSNFARRRHRPGSSHSYFDGSPAELLALVREYWTERRPGTGRTGLSEVVVVPLPPDRFVSGTVKITADTPLAAEFTRRQPHEDGYVRVTAAGPREEVRYAAAVLYSADTLLANDGERSGDWDWEVVGLIAGPRAEIPMDPLTMARNMLGKPGGTHTEYTARQFAEAVYYWSQRAHAPTP
jgi:hypothetical protein